MANGIGDFYTN